MRLGAPVYDDEYHDPESWVRAVQSYGYRAAYCPVGPEADAPTVRAYRDAAERADLVIAEVGAWHHNPLSPDEAARAAAIAGCQRALALADEIGARCCVNVAGSRDPAQWDGPHPDNLTPDTFDLIVESVRAIIDGVQPARAVYTLEPMPCLYPDSPQSYLRLLDAIDRPAFGVHLDPVNLITSPALYYGNAAFLRECFRLLGPRIAAVHAKDIVLRPRLTVHLDEVRPGLGTLDYAVLLRELDRLHADVPLLLEHLPREEYAPAAAFVRGIAAAEGIAL
ncbi:MAG: sugar phosphate isomerase/epimerase [Anaerolineae bacterium]|nr:sugar phosphate isomerase/epimerase [Anaerolineae bacterium]